MAKLAVLGQNPNTLVDCSEVIPQPKGNPAAATIPAGKNIGDINSSCPNTRFPRIATAAGRETSLAAVYVFLYFLGVGAPS